MTATATTATTGDCRRATLLRAAARSLHEVTKKAFALWRHSKAATIPPVTGENPPDLPGVLHHSTQSLRKGQKPSRVLEAQAVLYGCNGLIKVILCRGRAGRGHKTLAWWNGAWRILRWLHSRGCVQALSGKFCAENSRIHGLLGCACNTADPQMVKCSSALHQQPLLVHCIRAVE